MQRGGRKYSAAAFLTCVKNASSLDIPGGRLEICPKQLPDNISCYELLVANPNSIALIHCPPGKQGFNTVFLARQSPGWLNHMGSIALSRPRRDTGKRPLLAPVFHAWNEPRGVK